jgi:ABC-type Fe3+-hydroxamate transport system substrate-binding protein
MAGAAAVALAVVLAGCSSGTSPSTSSSATSSSSSSASSAVSGSTGYPAGKEQVCQARDQLKTSISALTNPTLLVGGADAIKAAVTQVQTDLGGIVAAGKQDYEPQVTAVQSSLDQLQTAVGNLGNGNVTQNIQAVGAAIAATGTAAADLFSQLKTTCGS